MVAVTGLGVNGGNEVWLSAEGPDAEVALDTVINEFGRQLNTNLLSFSYRRKPSG